MKRDWLQIVSNIAIISGLAIVVYELNQSRDLAFGQMINGEYSMINDRYLAAMGDSPHHALAKAALEPSTITAQDAVVLDAYYNAVIYSWYGVIRMMEATGIERDWRGTVSNSTREIFTTEPGRRWLLEWAERGSWVEDDSVDHLYSNAWSEIEKVALRAIEENEHSGWIGATPQYSVKVRILASQPAYGLSAQCWLLTKAEKRNQYLEQKFRFWPFVRERECDMGVR